MGVAVSFLGILIIVAIIAIIGVVIGLIFSKKSPDTLDTKEGSYFDGGYFAYIGYSLLVGFVTAITLGIAFPWMCCLMQRWIAKHTVVCGKRQYFDGTGIQLIGKFILWSILTVITFGIYGFWMALAIKKWLAKHTHFVGEEDNNSYFDGGILGFIGTNILAFFVMFIPFVGFAWSNIIKLNWERSHTVIDSRRLVFKGTVGNFFLKYLLWGILTAITFGIFALFIPVKNFKLEAENTIDHEHTDKALMEQSEYQNKVNNTVSINKNTNTEFEMEGLKAGINDTTDEAALKTFADNGSRAAQYLYVIRYANEQYTAEPFSSMLKASAEAGFAPAMCLYALTHELEETYKNELLEKAAEQGQIEAIKNRMNYYVSLALAESNSKTAEELLKKAIFFANILKGSDETLSAEEELNIKNCVLKLRKIKSGKGVSSKIGAGVIAVVIAFAMIIIFAVLAVIGIFIPVRFAKADESTRPNTRGTYEEYADDYNSDGIADTAVAAEKSGISLF